MAGVRTEVKGLRELGEKFKELSFDMQKVTARRAARAAAVLVRDRARENAARLFPIGRIGKAGRAVTGAMAKAIAVGRNKQAKNLSKQGKEFFAVGVFRTVGGTYAKTRLNQRKGRVGKKFYIDAPTFYWKFLELGTVKRGATPFLDPALSAHRGEATVVMTEQLRAGIEKMARKLRGRGP